LTSALSKPSAASTRVLGWDLLRGVCALAVCSYHLLMWMDVTSVYPWGLYGVYLFFVLSGASLAFTYGGQIQAGKFSFTDFLATRYVRLAPLYLALLLLLLPWKLAHESLSLAFIAKLALNLCFLFGFWHPASQSMLVGGWSLGIEAVFYLTFPLIMGSLQVRYLPWLLWLGLLGLQLAWIGGTVGLASGFDANTQAYHHVPAFAAYFFGGCLIGQRRLRANPAGPGFATGFAAILGCFALMLWLNTPDAAAVLTGWRGGLLTALCFLLVAAAGSLQSPGQRLARLAVGLGNTTYGLYLIHPVIFFGLSYALLPQLGFTQPFAEWSLGGRLALAGGIIVSAFVLAWASEHGFERPLRRRVRSYLDRRASLKGA
jgi:peptidoglycan/LPS O-acetylase OafA/YrhL